MCSQFQFEYIWRGCSWKCKLFHLKMLGGVRKPGSQEMLTIFRQVSRWADGWLFTLLYSFDVLLVHTVSLFGLLRWLVGLFWSDWDYPQNKTAGTLPPSISQFTAALYQSENINNVKKYTSNILASICIQYPTLQDIRSAPSPHWSFPSFHFGQSQRKFLRSPFSWNFLWFYT